uniref:Uncharacterized protein n=1 Tax=Apteryx owenii TaxID=8824 RepID=A0A8B9PYS5_APTOW
MSRSGVHAPGPGGRVAGAPSQDGPSRRPQRSPLPRSDRWGCETSRKSRYLVAKVFSHKMCLFNSLEQKHVFGFFFFLVIISEPMCLPCRKAPLLCCSAILLKHPDERIWKDQHSHSTRALPLCWRQQNAIKTVLFSDLT